VKVFDFDDTLYNGESVFDFALFVIKRKKSFIWLIPSFVRILLLYKLCWYDISSFTAQISKYSKVFMKNQELIRNLVAEFWEENIHKLYPEMLKKVTPKDVIITSSPSFLIDGIKDVLHTNHILSTELDFENGKILYLNFQENKVKKFQEVYKNRKIKYLYTDSFNDEKLMDISENVFLVKKGKCKKIK